MAQAETEQLNRILTSVSVAYGIGSVTELGIPDLIQAGQPQPVSSLATATKTHEPSLYRVLRLLASNGIFQETTNRHFDHTPLSAVLRSDAPGSYHAGARFFHRLFPAWNGLHHSIQTGEPGFNKVFGAHVFEYVGRNPEWGPILDGGMSSFHGYETQAMLDAYDFSGIQTLADIGGGNGSLISAVLKRYPGMNGILFDLGHVMERAKQNLQAAGVADRCSMIEGSFFDSIPSGADAYLMRHVIHDWTDEQCGQILDHCRNVIPAGGRLLIVECVVPSGNDPSPAKDFDIAMMTLPGGQERTEVEFRWLLNASGFELASITPTSTMVCVVEGRPV